MVSNVEAFDGKRLCNIPVDYLTRSDQNRVQSLICVSGRGRDRSKLPLLISLLTQLFSYIHVRPFNSTPYALIPRGFMLPCSFFDD